MPQTININGQDVSVEQFKNDWALALMTKGVIVKLSIKRWPATISLTPESLGLKFKNDDSYEAYRKYVYLGRQNLLPPDIISEIRTTDSRARALLDSYSFDTIWGKFVPFTAFKEWERENARLKDLYLQQAISLGSQYKTIIEIVRKDYKKMAEDVWMRLYPNSNSSPNVSFIETFSNQAISKIPTQMELIESFRYTCTYTMIPLPSFIQEDIAKSEDIKRKISMANFESEIEKEVKRKISEEYIQKKKELIDGFLEATVTSMRKHVAELCNTVLISISRKSKISIANINKLKEMIKKIRFLNFHNDKEIKKMLNELDAEINKSKGENDQVVISDKLKEIIDLSKKEYSLDNFNPSISVLEA